ncbi:diguanylate cyclase [Pseudomonas sp. NW5]|uniref:sensor domain-containing diguanylate cyclase n=1 Tax=Pseudomonas sp. NW5 TaxID=2934934 RepID=UPI0020223A5B|nr:diguanylate cyclase [Pseudomonas sp. NW5]MCL7462766.1 diguanylate cyclase [Pseudomonas sp. NW5]
MDFPNRQIATHRAPVQDREAALPDSLLASALEQCSYAALITDATLDGAGPSICYVNAAFCRMSGYAPEELLGQSPRRLQGPLTNRDVLQQLRAQLRAGESFRGSTINYRKDGTPYAVEWNISPVRDAQGRITHFMALQQMLCGDAARPLHLLARALDVAGDAVLIANARGVIEFVNQGFQRLTGYPADEVQGRTLVLLRPGLDVPRFCRTLWQNIAGGQTYQCVVTHRHRAGHELHCEETITPIFDANGVASHFISITRDISERLKRERELQQQATRDALTGLFNRRGGERHLERAYQATQELGQMLCVMLADVDHFKRINDRWGHAAGDRVLREVADLLQGNVRSSDRVVRWGGEEFLLILPSCPLKAALAQADRLRELIGHNERFEIGPITLSIGVAELQVGESLASLIDRADKALYRAKNSGRNQVRPG